MKKLLLSAVALFTFVISNAQDQVSKGKILVEANTGNAMIGTTGFYFSSQDGNSEYNLGIDGGYFIMDKLAIKAGLGYGGYKNKVTDGNMLSYRLGAKYYALSKIPVSLDLTGASIKDANENPLWLGVGAGYAWFLGDKVSIEPGVRYNHSLNEDYTDKGIFQLNVGFALYF